MSDKKEIYKKLLELRKAIPYMQKDTNGYNYKYTKGVDILEVVKPKMAELNLLLIPQTMNSEIQTFTDIVKGKEKVIRLVKARMTYTWVDVDSGQELTVMFDLFGEQDDISKAYGSGLTYSERYFLLKFFQIETDDADPDAKQKQKETKKEKEINEKRVVLFNYVKQMAGITSSRLSKDDTNILQMWTVDNWGIKSLNEALPEKIEELYKEVANG